MLMTEMEKDKAGSAGMEDSGQNNNEQINGQNNGQIIRKSTAADLIIVRGAGDISTGTIHRLFRAGFPVLALETDHPSAIRRKVAFSEAVYDGTATVEGITAVRISGLREMTAVLEKGQLPLLVDPEGQSIRQLCPTVVVDAILAKKNLGTSMDMADLTIALGPGFEAGKDVRYVIETMRGHDLGRIISSGFAAPNTGVPGLIGGFGAERVILRGIIRDEYPVTRGFKLADVDPRLEELKNCFTISDKARCIAGSVLELVCAAGG